MKQKQIGVVVLNYISYKVTEDCVQSFLKQNSDNINVQIVVVDNCSPNNSFSILKEKYKNNVNITVVKTPRNLGFAKGNNYGYRILKEKITPDFIIASNSDVYLENPGLYQWIFNAYKQYHFGVLGPSIYSVRGGFYQSPVENSSKDLHEIHSYKRNLRKYLLKMQIKKILRYKEEKREVNHWDNPYYRNVHSDKTLHGAFQIFSKKFLDIYDSLYDDRTFLYLEENILRLRCDYANLPMIYLPTYKVNHLQAISTSHVVKTNYDKEIFRSKNILKSYKIYESILKGHLRKKNGKK